MSEAEKKDAEIERLMSQVVEDNKEINRQQAEIVRLKEENATGLMSIKRLNNVIESTAKGFEENGMPFSAAGIRLRAREATKDE
jgi:peptidoglycan hydrolase CwlO-like protein